ncbi:MULTISPECIES: esterase-like activity of phytase family protein [unclassified Iodidimonas]|jgi:hypothetical protein|uniref:esterase-like activity of phytase family protein n=1 Tax=unclassified Iodidimonas TaxID=2626145 RepID=UPI0024831627|nr:MULTISPECIES: esterase-like activity of phytase family protein [unclassified Iodidimonas]
MIAQPVRMARKSLLRILILMMGLSLAGCFAHADQTAPPDGVSLGMADDGLVIESREIGMYSPANPAKPRTVGQLEFVTALELTSKNKDFGGISSIEISADGKTMIGLTDRGQWLWMELDSAAGDGRPTGVGAARMAPMRGADGVPLAAGDRDSESLILMEDGLWVGYESHDRVLAFAPEGFDRATNGAADVFADPTPFFLAPGVAVEVPPMMLDHPGNGGLEAMVRLANGAVVAFSEHGRMKKDGPLKAWIYRDGIAAAMALDAPEGFSPTGAALLPDGDVLLLLRSYSPLRGVRARLLRIDAAAILPDAVLKGDELARLEPPMTVDNMEGLAVHVDTAGQWMITIISDDNFSPLQRTILLRYKMPQP